MISFLSLLLAILQDPGSVTYIKRIRYREMASMVDPGKVSRRLHSTDGSLRTLTRSSQEPPTLLTMPGELRNRIYRDALVTDLPIHVTRDENWKQPALLATSKQIRRETYRIYYLENHFILETPDMDDITIYAFTKHALPYRPDWFCSGGPRYSVLITGQPNWSNLVRWMQAWYEGRVLPIAHSETMDSALKTAATAFEMLRELHDAGAPWEPARRVLELYRKGVDEAGHTWTWQ